VTRNDPRTRRAPDARPMDQARAKEILRALGARADVDGLSALSDDEQTVLAPYLARGIIGNGGFRAFFEGEHALSQVARRMRALGLVAAGDACDRVLEQVFLGGVAPTTAAEREALLGRVDWAAFEDEEDVVFEVSWDQLTAAVVRYMERRPDAFSVNDPD
jgi:hypothetical protein